jgi:glycosyltransferase involved in cell wall biosynthesis
MRPLVSILIPAHTSERWITPCIQSALRQTRPPEEIIVVDDGSTDSTLKVARQFSSKGIQVLTQPNQGASVARNTAFAACQGDYIQWLDADDLLEPDKIERQMDQLKHCRSKMTLLSGAWGKFYYRKSKAHFDPTTLWCDLTPLEWMMRKMGQNLHMQTDNWLITRELSNAAGPWDRRLFRDNDGEYLCRVICASDGIRFVKDARSYYRFSGFGSISYIGRSAKKIESYYLSMQLHMGYLRSLEDSERTRRACLQASNRMCISSIPNWTWWRSSEPRRPNWEASSSSRGFPDCDWLRRSFRLECRPPGSNPSAAAQTVSRMAWDKAMFAVEARRPVAQYLQRGWRRPLFQKAGCVSGVCHTRTVT